MIVPLSMSRKNKVKITSFLSFSVSSIPAMQTEWRKTWHTVLPNLATIVEPTQKFTLLRNLHCFEVILKIQASEIVAIRYDYITFLDKSLIQSTLITTKQSSRQIVKTKEDNLPVQ